MPPQFWIETLGCPKNQVDSDKLVGTMLADGMAPAAHPDEADVVVVNTCAFIAEARQESVDTILEFDSHRKDGSRLVVTGCMAERYGSELGKAMPEISAVAPFGVPVALGPTRSVANGTGPGPPSFDLLELPRPAASAPWAYVKVAEGCDRNCGFCAIPAFRGKQRSRSIESILAEVEALADAGRLQEVVLVAQDLAAFGRDQGRGSRQIVPLVRRVAERVARVRLLYLYPSDLTDELIDTMCGTGVAYFDLSLQHVSPSLLRRMRRWGSGQRFTERIEAIRAREPDAAFRSNSIVGYPGETEADHDSLLAFIERSQLDWCGFFAYSEEEDTYGADLEPKVSETLIAERLHELRSLQDSITVSKRDALIGHRLEVLVDQPGQARSEREAPEIDGIIHVPVDLAVGQFHTVKVTAALGPDLEAKVVPS
ncbi:MAG: 30S ribosomal protein S12 methylthiotransferase RimO [Actinomycetia bacterium]|nr:30S ribosomal protein S12 methylthiotransferase RimO [Actinomycetes bacterium]